MNKKIFIQTCILGCFVFQTKAQWNFTGDAVNPGDFLGTTNTQPLLLKTTATGSNAQNINFYTNGSQKMTILGNNTSSDGYVGIGTASPSNYLHVNKGGNYGVYGQFTNGNSTNGFWVGVDASTGNGILNMKDAYPLKFHVNSDSYQRMSITSGGNVIIGQSNSAQASLLHIDGVTSGGVQTGDIFSTNGMSNSNNYWRMLTGGTERFNIKVPSSTNNAELNVVQAGGTFTLNSPNTITLNQSSNSGTIDFATNSTKRATILNNGFMGVNQSTPIFGFHTTGTGYFTNTNVLSGSGVFTWTLPSLAVQSTIAASSEPYEGDALTILAPSGQANNLDGLKIFGDDTRSGGNSAGIYHWRTRGSAGIQYNSSFDHVYDAGRGAGFNKHLYSWIAFNNQYGVTTIREDFNSNPTLTGPAQQCKLFVHAINPRGWNSGINSVGIYSLNENNTTDVNSLNQVGVYGESNSIRHMAGLQCSQNVINRGGMFIATGVVSDPDDDGCTNGWNQGVFGEAKDNADLARNFGGWFASRNDELDPNNQYNIENIGAVGIADGAQDNWGLVGVAFATVAGSNAYPAAFNGTTTSTSFPGFMSDSIFKINVADYKNPHEVIKLLKPRTFNYDIANNPALNFDSKLQYGFIAQELQTVFPDLVNDIKLPSAFDKPNQRVSGKYYKAVNYLAMIAILTSGLQEQYAVNDTLHSRIDSLKQQMDSVLQAMAGNSLRQNNNNSTGYNKNTNGNAMTVELENTTAIILNQNDPNPYSEQTKITWNIPAESLPDAKLFFHDKNGTVLKIVKIEQAGYGELIVYASNLSNGTYTYSLVINGKTIDTKRMVKAK